MASFHLNDQQPFIITGMHRSGTSLTASLIESCGVNLGSRLMAAGFGNPKGHFENLDFVEFHKKTLSAIGANNEGWSIQGPVHVPGRYVECAVRLIEDSSSSSLWGWKDPRSVLFLDFWHNLLPNARFIFVYRAPWLVVDSLYRRGDRIFIDNPRHAISSWQQYNEMILDFYQRFPEKSILLSIESIIESPELITNSISQKFGIDLDNINSDLVDTSLLKLSLESDHRKGIIRKFFPEANEIYQCLSTWSQSGALFQDTELHNQTEKGLTYDCDWEQDWVLDDWMSLRKSSREMELSVITCQECVQSLEETSKQLSSEKGISDHLTQANQELNIKNENLEAENHKLNIKNENLEAGNQSLRAQLDRIRQEAKSKEKMLMDAIEERKIIEEHRDMLDGQLALKDKALQHAQDQYTLTQEKTISLESELSDLAHLVGEVKKSKFWKIRNFWFELKKKLGVIDDDKLLI